jgi:hypothetical protein
LARLPRMEFFTDDAGSLALARRQSHADNFRNFGGRQVHSEPGRQKNAGSREDPQPA